ncbi:MAG: hypothetical protein WC519_01315 [Parcubacteria group bacterium]
MESFEKAAKILRTDKDTVLNLERKMNASFGTSGVLQRIMEQNEELIRRCLDTLGIGRNVEAKEVYDALISKIEADDSALFKLLGCPSPASSEHCNKLLLKARTVASPNKGLFMKLDVARKFIENEPPQKVIKALGYENVKDLLAKEDIYEIYASLRFIEGSEFLNDVFFKQYETLTPNDFEEREIEVKAINSRWMGEPNGFVKKKYHNVSHLKEIGLIFTLPVQLGISGEILREFSLILHYFSEMDFYSRLIRNIAAKPDGFSKNLILLLRGDALDKRLPEGEKAKWLVIPRYFAKDDEHDWRLFEPHINPEALHWEKAERMLDTLPIDMSFWRGMNWVGEDFKTNTGIDVLVSFNLVDTVMSLVKHKEMIKYLYHYQEAFWNKIFSEYAGEEKMEEMMEKHLLDGWFEI